MKTGQIRLIRRFVVIGCLLVTGLFFTWLLVTGPGISIPLDGFRQPIELAATRALGREVRIAGALALKAEYRNPPKHPLFRGR